MRISTDEDLVYVEFRHTLYVFDHDMFYLEVRKMISFIIYIVVLLCCVIVALFASGPPWLVYALIAGLAIAGLLGAYPKIRQ